MPTEGLLGMLTAIEWQVALAGALGIFRRGWELRHQQWTWHSHRSAIVPFRAGEGHLACKNVVVACGSVCAFDEFAALEIELTTSDCPTTSVMLPNDRRDVVAENTTGQVHVGTRDRTAAISPASPVASKRTIDQACAANIQNTQVAVGILFENTTYKNSHARAYMHCTTTTK
jgi:hypothetical protein